MFQYNEIEYLLYKIMIFFFTLPRIPYFNFYFNTHQ